MEIENIPLKKRESSPNDFREFILSLQKLQIGTSFKTNKFPSNFRMAISIYQILSGATICARKEGDGYRIGRTA